MTARLPGRHLVERLFLAVPLDDEARHGVAAKLDPHLGDGKLPGKAVPMENWHLTLRFLGDSTARQRDVVLERLARHHLGNPFRLRLSTLGAFPSEARANVLWLGVGTGSENLFDLAEATEDAARAAGFEEEDRPFHPHLTLSRLRPAADVTDVVETVPAVGVSMTVRRVVLYRSVLGDGPTRYEVVDDIPLH